MTRAAVAQRPDLGELMLTSAEAARCAGITGRQLDYWVRHGVICPTGVTSGSGATVADRWSPGSGSRRWFSVEQVAALAACGRLARLCADTAALQALVLALDGLELPATVAIDGDGRVNLVHDGQVPATMGACWIVTADVP